MSFESSIILSKTCACRDLVKKIYLWKLNILPFCMFFLAVDPSSNTNSFFSSNNFSHMWQVFKWLGCFTLTKVSEQFIFWKNSSFTFFYISSMQNLLLLALTMGQKTLSGKSSEKKIKIRIFIGLILRIIWLQFIWTLNVKDKTGF